MKKFIILAFALALLGGCRPETQEQIKCEDNTTIYARKFTFEEHQYIEFYRHSPGTYDNYTGFVHDPNCWCMIDYD